MKNMIYFELAAGFAVDLAFTITFCYKFLEILIADKKIMSA